MMKRIIALLLALILTIGLLPTVALAAGETENNAVVSGSIGADGNWTPEAPDQSNMPKGVETVSKTAKPTSNPNEYEVELKVVLKQTSETKTGAAATALVLDCSGSMDWCTECGQDWCRHKTDDTYNVTFDVHNSNSYYVIENGKYVRVSYCDGYHFLSSCDGGAGWYTSDRKRDHKSQNKLTPKISQTDSAATHVQFYTRTEGSFDTSRMTAAKNAAKNFLKTYSGFDASVINDDGTLKKPAPEDLSIKRYVAVIRFSNNIDNDTDSSSWWEGEDYKPAWYDVSTVVGYNKVLATINNASAGGGTNLDAGLTTASSLMDADLVKNLTSKNVIALTDGAPTYSKSYGDGGSTNQDICNETAKTAETLRVKSKVYTVCFAAESEPLYDGGGTIGNFLKKRIATQPAEGSNETYAYNAKSAEDLIKVFKDITDTIVSGLNNGTVKDTLPTGITSGAFGEDKVKEWELNDETTFTRNVGEPETVNGKQVTTYTYTKTYTVTIDPKTVKTEKVDGVDYAPLNGETTLTVKNSQGTDVEIPFPIPAGKVTMPSYTVTFKDGVNEAVFEDETQQVEYGKPIPSHADPVRPGYNFTGWTSEPANYRPGTGTMPANNITFTAQWTEKTSVTISYVAKEGGSVNKASESLNPDTGEATGSTAAASTGYTFDGWYSDSECTEAKKVGGQATFIPTKPTTGWVDGTTFYAKFTKNTYTVTYTDGVDGAEVFADDEHNNVAYGDTIPVFTNGTPTREGYNFIGWTSSVEGVTPSSAMPASNVTFTAQWKEKDKVTINYVAKTGGSVTLANETLNPDTGVAVGSTATASTGYRFVGWYDNSECTGTALSKDASYTPSKPEAGWADKTYYAKFESLTYTITFKTENGGTINDQTNDITHPGLTTGTTFPAVPTTKANTGYYFLGWYDESGDKVEETAFPEKVTGNATYTAKWHSYNSTKLDLTGKIQKTLNSDVALTNEIFTINLTLNGAEVASATATATVSATTASGTGYTGSAPFQTATDEFKLTFTAPGTYNYSIVEEQPVRSGMTYDDGFATTGHSMTVVVEEDAAHALSVTSVTVDGTAIALTDTDATWLTITNTYTEPKEPSVVSKTVVTTDMVDMLPDSVSNDIAAFKKINNDILYPVVNGEASTLEVPYGTKSVTLLYKITVNAGTKTSMQFEDVGAERVSVFDDDNVDVSQVGRTFTVRFYRGVTTADIYVAKTYKKLVFDSNGECTVENVISEEIKATTTVTEKDPNKLTINFADYVQKELAATGTKTASDVDFTVDVKGKEQTMIITSAEGEEAISTYADEFDPKYSRTLTAHFDSITGGEVKTTRFTGTTVEIDHAGHYTFFLGEEKGTRTGVTYDEARYTLYINVRLDQNENKLYVSSMGAIRTNADGTWENIALIEMVNDKPVRTTNYITFHNTIDTGKDDYYPIIIPTIINKDTGMLNKTDHFAYVIGYPDGTVHPNGQITRAEVATIFFRLLRDEVRDGAFTTSNTYSDVAYGKWYNNPISTMSALGIITGYPDGTFKPNKPITRAEFAAIAARFDETQSGKSATFSDVIGHWAAKEIGIAYYNDWIKGYPDGTFKPDQNITRAEAMTLINRVLERKPESPADLLTNMNKWTDNLDTSKWYYLDVQEATNSHGYTRKTFNYELWRQMLPDPDWSRYER